MPNIQWKMKGFKDIRKSPEMVALLQKIVDEMVDDLGEGYVGEVGQRQNRARGGVVAASEHAKRENARDNTLLRALAKARGDA